MKINHNKKAFKKMMLIGVLLAVFYVVGKSGVFFPLVTTAYSLEKNMIFDSIMSKTSEYKQIDTFYASVWYTNADEPYADFISRNLSFFYELIMHDFLLEDLRQTPEKVYAIIYPGKEEMGRAIGVTYESPPMGVYFGGIIHILSPEQWIKGGTETDVKERFLKEGPLVHELAHMAVDITANGNYPIWFTEGIALYFENKYTGFEWRADLAEISKSISYDDLNEQFRELDESAAYRRSYDIISSIVNEKGENAIINMLQRLGRGISFKTVFNAEFIEFTAY